MRTNSRLPNSRGFREVDIVQEIEIVAPISTEDSILQILSDGKEHTSQELYTKLKMPETTVRNRLRSLEINQHVTSRTVLAKVNGAPARRMKLYKLLK